MTTAETQILKWLEAWRVNVTMTDEIRSKLTYYFRFRPTTY